MTTKNNTILRVERGVAGEPRINHLEFQRACDKFLRSRGKCSAHFRRSAWLFGKKARAL